MTQLSLSFEAPKKRRPVRVGDVVRATELCLGGGVVTGKALAVESRCGLVMLEGVGLWCGLADAEVVL